MALHLRENHAQITYYLLLIVIAYGYGFLIHMLMVVLPASMIGPWVRLLHATGVDISGVGVIVRVLVTVGDLVGTCVAVVEAVAVVVPVLVGVRVERTINWRAADGAVVRVSGATYYAAGSPLV